VKTSVPVEVDTKVSVFVAVSVVVAASLGVPVSVSKYVGVSVAVGSPSCAFVTPRCMKRMRYKGMRMANAVVIQLIRFLRKRMVWFCTSPAFYACFYGGPGADDWR